MATLKLIITQTHILSSEITTTKNEWQKERKKERTEATRHPGVSVST